MMARYIFLLTFFSFNIFLFPRPLFGQRVTISTWSGSDDVTIHQIGTGSNSLNFNQHSNVITANSGPIKISKEDINTAIFAIEAPSEFEIVINMDYSPYLTKAGDSSKGQSIPIVFYLAYNNKDAANEIVAKNESIDLIKGITSMNIPVNPRFAANLSPSRSEYGRNSERPKSVVYLFIFGTLGPIGSVSAGDYSTQINLNVNVANEKN